MVVGNAKKNTTPTGPSAAKKTGRTAAKKPATGAGKKRSPPKTRTARKGAKPSIATARARPRDSFGSTGATSRAAARSFLNGSNRAAGVAAASAPRPASELSLQARITALRSDAGRWSQRANAYLDAQDQIAGANFQSLQRLAQDSVQRETGSPFNVPGDTDRLRYDERKKLQGVATEMTRQLRQDLRAGRTSAFLDTPALDRAPTADAAVAQMRVQQGLQAAGIPEDFRGHSPKDMDGVRQLQRLHTGAMPLPDEKVAQAALGRTFEGKGRAETDRAIDRMIRDQRVPEGLGLELATPNARDVPGTLESLQRQRDAIDSELKKLGRDPLEMKAVDDTVARMQKLDDTVADFGEQLAKQHGASTETFGLGADGKITEVPKPPFDKAPVAEANGDLGRQPELTRAQQDELVRVNDSLELLRGNRSGLSIADVPMTPGLRDALDLPEGIGTAAPTKSFDPFRVFQPKHERQSATERIDRAALMPVEHRAGYLNGINGELFRDGLSQKSHTKLNAEFENTFLNRTAEVLDPFSYILQSKDTDWIGPRAKLRTEQANNIGKKVSGLTDDAGTDLIYGRHGAAMEKMRQTTAPLDFHRGINADYDQRLADTEMRTGMMLATAPLSAVPAAQLGLRGGKAMIRGGGRMLKAGQQLSTSVMRKASLGSVRKSVGRGLGGKLRRVPPVQTAPTPSGSAATAVSNNADATVSGFRQNQAFSDDVFRPGRQVGVRRSNGALEPDWQIKNIDSQGRVVVHQPDKGIQKAVRPERLVAENPELLSRGQQVRIQRGTGAVEDGWEVIGEAQKGRVRVWKDGLFEEVPVRDLVNLNHQRLVGTHAPMPPRGNVAKVAGTGRAQSVEYQGGHRIDGHVQDGFADGGRGMSIDDAGRVTSDREVLVVDRARDANLGRHMQFARGLRKLPPEQRAQQLARYVDDMMNPAGGRHLAIEAHDNIVGAYPNAELLIGDIPAAGGGVCRHRSVMFQVLAEEAGLESTLVRGNHGGGRMVGGHAWNEVQLPNGRVLVDVMQPEPDFLLPRLDRVGPEYLDMHYNPLYGN